MKLIVKQKTARIELIPLIDIIFLLLVFFIYSMLSMVVYRGIPVTLPAADSVKTERKAALVVTIDERGDIFVDRMKTSQEDLLRKLKRLRMELVNEAVIISGHGDADYRIFVDVLDKVRLAGFQKISIEARPREDAP
jgi:biopolymer transport protein ExbD